MKEVKTEEIKKEILNPKNLWIADTRLCTTYSVFDCVRAVYSEPKRKSIPVIRIADHFIELASVSPKFKLSRCKLFSFEPTHEYEEYVDVNTLKEYPFDDGFDFENVTIESLKEMEKRRQKKKICQKS